MPEDSVIQLFRLTNPSSDGKKWCTSHLILHVRQHTTSHALIRDYDFGPGDSWISEVTIRRPDSQLGLPLISPFDQPDLGKRIVLSRASMSVGCDINDWIESKDPEYDLLVFLLAARKVDNAAFISQFIAEMRRHNLLSDNFIRVLSEMQYGIYVEAQP